jgi:PAS domain S-box-containing protein
VESVLESTTSDARLDAVVRSLHDAVCLIDAGGRVVATNDEFRNHWVETFGRSPRAGEPLDDSVARSEEATFWTDFIRRALRGRTMMADGWHEVAGRKRYLAVSSTPVVVDDAADGATIVVRDITDRRSRGHREIVELALTRIFGDETSLVDNLTKVMEFLCAADGWELGIVWLTEDRDLVPAAVWHDGSPHAVEFEEAARSVRFAPGHGIPGRALRDNELIWVPDLSDETVNLRTLHASRLGFRGVVAIPIADSHNVIGVFELFTRAVRQVNDETARALHDTGIAVGRLIERHRSHEERAELLAALERKSTEWARTFDSIPLPIFLTTKAGAVTRLNRAARALVGGDYADILGQPIAALGDGEPWPTLRDCVDAVATAGSPCTAQAVDTIERHWDVSGSAFNSADAAEERVIIVLRDVTTIVQLQESVRRGEQLAAMGELVAGVAHEVRNPLFGMTITLDAYESSVKVDGDAAEMFNALRQWIARLNTLMENLLEYGKTWNVELREGFFNDVVAEAITLSSSEAAMARVRIRNACDTADLPLLMDSARLVQAIQNLIINAIQHSEPRGEVVVYARRDGDQIECEVRDHGPGFREDDLPRIFEPFFTRRRGGTGLGLSIVQRVTDEHGGTVTAENVPNGGARVRLRFPRFQRP